MSKSQNISSLIKNDPENDPLLQTKISEKLK